MNRTAGIALAVAAVIGTTGGTFAAAQLAGRGTDPNGSLQPGASSSSGPSGPSGPSGSASGPTPSSTDASPTPTDAPSEPPAKPATDDPLWMTPTEIHDGETVVRIDRLKDAAGLERIKGGWLVVTTLSSQEPSYRAHVVSPDGTVTKLVDFFGSWDVNQARDRFIAMDPGGTEYPVRELPSGKVVARVNEGMTGKTQGYGGAAFSGADLITSWYDGGHPVHLKFDQDTALRSEVGWNLFGVSVSPWGTRLVGQAATEGDSEYGSCLTGGPVDAAEERWTDCSWAPATGAGNAFSPDGTKVLAMPIETDGFGPGVFGILDSGTGRVLSKFDTPEATLDARFLDNDSLLVWAANGYDEPGIVGSVLYTCSLEGECEKLTTLDPGVVQIGQPDPA